VRKALLVLSCLVVCILGVSPANAASYAGYVKTGTGVVINGVQLSFERSPVNKNGRILAPGRTLCSSLGAKVDWYENQGKISVTGGGTVINMYIGSSTARIGNTVKEMDVAPYLQNGTVMLPIRFTAESLSYKVGFDTRSNSVVIGSGATDSGISRGDDRKNFKVVIDAGHGGSDTGAVVSGVYEKNLNLDIAKRLQSLLKEEGITTYMTRTGDTKLTLYQRSDLANSVKADLLVSIHNNAQNENWVAGSMTLYYPYGGNSKGGLTAKEFASIVQSKLSTGLGAKNLGIIERPKLAVLRTAKMPAVIAEVGYMTNKTELNNLLTSKYKQKAAVALKDAIIKSLDKI